VFAKHESTKERVEVILDSNIGDVEAKTRKGGGEKNKCKLCERERTTGAYAFGYW